MRLFGIVFVLYEKLSYYQFNVTERVQLKLINLCFISKKLMHVKEKKYLRFNIILKLITCGEINQVTSKCQMGFLDKKV